MPGRIQPWALVILLATGLWLQETQLSAFPLNISLNATNGQAYLSTAPGDETGALYELEASTNLVDWSLLGRFSDYIAPYPALSASGDNPRFYRAVRRAAGGTTPWISQIKSVNDPAIGYWGPTVGAKFVIFADRPDQVFFQNGSIPFHHLFISSQFPEFADISTEELDELALYPSRQEIVLGGLVVSTGAPQMYGIELLGLESYEPDHLIALFELIKSRVRLEGYTAYLLPSGSQVSDVYANIDYFHSRGVPVATSLDFAPNAGAHSEGWAVGVLKYVPAADLESAVLAGELTPETVLLTDFAPRVVPPVAGIICLTPSSPNSHAALLMQASGRPFIDISTEQGAQVTNLIGKKVVFGTTSSQTILPDAFRGVQSHLPPSWSKDLHLYDAALFSEELLGAISGAGSIHEVEVPAMQRAGTYSKNTETLTPADTKYFGGKAANYGFLRRAIPANSPPAIAFSFDLWMDFMEQRLPIGKTLAEEMQIRLDGITPETNPFQTSALLKQIRDLIEDTAQFSPDQKTMITNALAVFDPARKIRFRSSSNAEDQSGFLAAGLYESYSGCLLDDFFPGPEDECLCDPTDDKRRSVFRAIKRVYASFYNEEAFLARRQAGISEEEVGMAILVHHSYPDEEELANGVATGFFVGVESSFSPVMASIISQRGAVSVTNPDGTELPEEYSATRATSFPGDDLLRRIHTYSTIRPPLTPVLKMPEEYDLMLSLMTQVAAGYFAEPASPGSWKLNFEFKKTARGLEIKQVRPIKIGNQTRYPILLPGKAAFVTYEGDFWNDPEVENRHQLKSIWEFETAGAILSTNNLSVPIFPNATVTYVDDGTLKTESFTAISPDSASDSTGLPNLYSGSLDSFQRIYQSPDGSKMFELEFFYPAPVPVSRPAILLSDLVMAFKDGGENGSAELVVDYSDQTLYGGFEEAFGWETNGVSIQIEARFGIHPNVPKVGLGYTYDLREWLGTTISGLTSEPLVLDSFFSQTYVPTRHNGEADVLFEPGLEPDLPITLRNELMSLDVFRIHLRWVNPAQAKPSTVELIGFNGNRRVLGE